MDTIKSHLKNEKNEDVCYITMFTGNGVIHEKVEELRMAAQRLRSELENSFQK